MSVNSERLERLEAKVDSIHVFFRDVLQSLGSLHRKLDAMSPEIQKIVDDTHKLVTLVNTEVTELAAANATIADLTAKIAAAPVAAPYTLSDEDKDALADAQASISSSIANLTPATAVAPSTPAPSAGVTAAPTVPVDTVAATNAAGTSNVTGSASSATTTGTGGLDISAGSTAGTTSAPAAS